MGLRGRSWMRLRVRPSRSKLFFRGRLANEKLLLINIGGHGDVEKSNHHFIVSLISPADGFVWIRIVAILGSVIEPRDGLQFGSGFQRERLGEVVAQLPIKIVVPAEKSFLRLIGVDDVVFKALAAQMHVRKKTEERGVVRQGAVTLDGKIVGTGRNQKTVVGELQGDYSLRGRMLCENNSGAGFVFASFAARCVMHLEN